MFFALFLVFMKDIKILGYYLDLCINLGRINIFICILTVSPFIFEHFVLFKT